MNRPNSTAENVPKIAEWKLSSCGLEVADFRKNCDCGIAIADSKKSCACQPLTLSQININDIITITIATGSDWLVVVAWAAAASAWLAVAWLAAVAWAAATPYLNR
jgi:hypothetical protein